MMQADSVAFPPRSCSNYLDNGATGHDRVASLCLVVPVAPPRVPANKARFRLRAFLRLTWLKRQTAARLHENPRGDTPSTLGASVLREQVGCREKAWPSVGRRRQPADPHFFLGQYGRWRTRPRPLCRGEGIVASSVQIRHSLRHLGPYSTGWPPIRRKPPAPQHY